VYVAIVVRSHPTQGVLEVKIQNGVEIDEIHDVQIISLANNNILQYSSADSLWHNVAGTTTNIAEGTNLYYTDTRARASISTTATGLTYTSGTGVLSLTAGYVIPTTTKATEWDTAYTNRITSATSPLSITSNVISIAQATTSTNGYLSSTDWTTFNNKQATLSLTTTGSSGAASLVSNTLNIPTYTLSGLGGVASSRTLTINGTAYDLSADRSWTIPTSVNATFTQDYTATASQTTFTVTGGYTVGQLAVYYNGSKLASAEFTATNGTTFVLATACQVNDIVQAVVEITGGGIGGSGTTNYISKFTASGVLGNSLIFDNGTNVGIGNTNTSYTLDVSGSGRYNGSYAGHLLNVQNTNASYYSSTDYYDNAGTEKLIVGYGNASTGNALASKAIIYGTSGVALNFYTNGSTTAKMVIDTVGYTGIGITAPTNLLCVSKDLTGEAIALIANTSATGFGLSIAAGGGSRYALAINDYANNAIARFLASGDVAIGTTTTGGIRLYVQSASNNWTGNFQGNTTSGQSLGLLVTAGTTSADSSFFIQNATGANLYMKVRGDGWFYIPSITNGAGSYALKWQSGGLVTFDTSSARYKDNIRDSNYGLSDVMKLRSAMFEYKSDARTDIGLIAEEIYEVIPELVTLNEDGLPDAVSYDRFVSVLIKAVQELSKQNEELSNRLIKLESK
jgi:hypothetical protein